jgi:hypothetical protein
MQLEDPGPMPLRVAIFLFFNALLFCMVFIPFVFKPFILIGLKIYAWVVYVMTPRCPSCRSRKTKIEKDSNGWKCYGCKQDFGKVIILR